MRRVIASTFIVALLLGLLVSGISCTKTVYVIQQPTQTPVPTPTPTPAPVARPIPTFLTTPPRTAEGAIQIVRSYLDGLATTTAAKATLLSFLTSVDKWDASQYDPDVWEVVARQEGTGVAWWYVIYDHELSIKPGYLPTVRLESELTGGPAPDEADAIELVRSYLLSQPPTLESKNNLEYMLSLEYYSFECHWKYTGGENPEYYGPGKGLVRDVSLLRLSGEEWWLEYEWYVRSGSNITPIGNAKEFMALLQQATPYGEGITFTYYLIKSQDGSNNIGGGGGSYDYQVLPGKRGVTTIEGRVLVSGSSGSTESMRILVVAGSSVSVGPGYDPVKAHPWAYTYVSPGETFRLEAATDIQYYVPGYSVVVFEQVYPPSGKVVRLPDITLVPGENRWTFRASQ